MSDIKSTAIRAPAPPRGGFLVGPALAGAIKTLIDQNEKAVFSTRVPRVQAIHEEPIRRGGGGGTKLRLGQFSGQWPNEPGPTGSGNVKVVTLYTMRTPQNNPNDYVPELDSNGDPVTAVVLNLFSHIPTQTAGDTPLWCLVMPFAGAGQYVSGYSFNEDTNNYDIPIYTDYSTLWLLVAAEC